MRQKANSVFRKKNKPFSKLSPSTNRLKGMDVPDLETSFIDHIEFSLAKDRFSATDLDYYKAAALTVRDRLVERWIETQQAYYDRDAKRVYYISMEFLTGRLLGNALINLNLYGNMKTAMEELGFDLEKIEETEHDAGLGNGGLGRLAACFLDSMATLELPAYGYGIRYEYGIFAQRIIDGRQVEAPDNWLALGNPWEIERPEYTYTVKFYGEVVTDENGANHWVNTEDVTAMAHDIPVPGFGNNTVNNLRLWSAETSGDFNLQYFNHGDYDRAVSDQAYSEIISKILYPRDDFFEGKELRLKQEYFLVSATLQDIMRRFKKMHSNFAVFPEKTAIQLNDTHPSLAIPELMRLLMDTEALSWEAAWDTCVRTFAYTNHTVLTEALEQWSVGLLHSLLPRHLQIIFEINRRFLDSVSARFSGDNDILRRMSLIDEEGEKRVRMAHLAIAGSHSVNGVAELHSKIIQERLFADFYQMYPEKFNNKTNGITQRRWLLLCNPGLSGLISDTAGSDWHTDLYALKKLEGYADDRQFLKSWRKIKMNNKKRLAEYIYKNLNITVDPESVFDCQIKRIHEYKRQLLNIIHVITLYNRLKNDPGHAIPPRTFIFSGKAAPSYYAAKLIIRLINYAGDVINNDPQIDGRLKVVFIPDYSVSIAQIIIPAADLSEQISTAGMEASGTGNMKFALNGALTIGTLDGANIEIMEEVGRENIYIFGMTAEEIEERRRFGYNSYETYMNDPELLQSIDMIRDGFFSRGDAGLFEPLVRSITGSDFFMVSADYADYVKCQEAVSREFSDADLWTRKAVINAANIGKFSSDRTISQYAEEIWNVNPVKIKLAGE